MGGFGLPSNTAMLRKSMGEDLDGSGIIRNAIDTNRSRREMSQAISIFLPVSQSLAPARDLLLRDAGCALGPVFIERRIYVR